MKALIRTSLNRPVSTLMMFTAVILTGILAVVSMPREYYPPMEVPKLIVLARYPSASPAEVKTLITVPLENALYSAGGLKSIRSISRNGSATLELAFHWGTDMLTAGVAVREIIDSRYPYLPKRAEKPVCLQIDPNRKPLLDIAVTSPNGDAAFIRRLAEREIATALQMVPGVGTVTLTGGITEEVAVKVTRNRALARGLENFVIASLIRSENLSYPAGLLEEDGSESLVVSDGTLSTTKEIDELWVMPPRGTPFRIRDIASAVLQPAEQTSFYLFDGSECVGLRIRRQGKIDPVELAKDLKEKVEELNFRYQGQIELNVVADSSLEITETIRTLVFGLAAGAGAALLIILILLGSWTNAVILLTSIPCSIALSLSILSILDISLNIQTLGGLTLGTGMLVDNSIIVLEHLAGAAAWREKETVFIRTAEMARSTGASTATSIIVFTPLFFLPGIIGVFYRDLALAVITALSASFIVSITLIPVLFLMIPSSRRNNRMDKAAEWYGTLLTWCSRYRGKTIFIALLLVPVALLSFYKVPKQFLPVTPERDVQVSIQYPPGTTLIAMKGTAKQLSNQLLDHPEVVHVIFRAGNEDLSTIFTADPKESLSTLHLQVLFSKAASSSLRSAPLQHLLSEYGNAALTFQKTDMLHSLFGLSGSETYLITAEDYEILTSNSREILSSLAASDIFPAIYPSGHQEEIRITPRRLRLAAAGISIEMLGRSLASLLEGSPAGSMTIEGNNYPISVHSQEEENLSIEDLEALTIAAPESGLISLNSILDITRVTGPAALFRSGRKDAQLMVFPEDIPDQTRLEEMLKRFPGLLSAEKSQLNTEGPAILLTFATALTLLYLILAAQFESYIDPLVILISIPLAAAGSIIILLWTGTAFTIQSLLAILVLFGTTVNSAIILRDSIQIHRGTVIASAMNRLRPIVISTATTIAALIPTAISLFGPTPQVDMAITIIGGLSISTLVALVIVPLFSMHGAARQ